MAVSDRSGKSNSGDYEYVLDDTGSYVVFPPGHPQEGHLVVNQDLVNFDLLPKDLKETAKLSPDKRCIAESFVLFAQENKLSFWAAEA
jgi:type I restriction enzyme M protein